MTNNLDNARKRRTTTAILEMNQELQDFYDFSPVGYIAFDPKGRILNANLTSVTMLNVVRKELQGRWFYDFVVREDRDIFYLHLRRLFRDKKPQSCRLRLQDSLDSIFHGELFSICSQDRLGNYCSRTVFMDVTEHKLMERELRRSYDELEERVAERTMELEEKTRKLAEVNAELIREVDRRMQFEADLMAQGEKLAVAYSQRIFLSRQLVKLLEKERREIGNSLHEEIGQILTGVALQLEKIKMDRIQDPRDIEEQVSTIQETLRTAVKQARNLSRNLRSEVLERYGLVSALKELASYLEDTSNMQVRVFTKDVPPDIDEEKALTIYRVVQESLTNALRHSMAPEISINLTSRNRTIFLSVEDNGSGFDYDRVSKTDQGGGSLGLTIMRERVNQVGGKFFIETSPGKGTLVLAEIPILTTSNL